MKMLLCCLDFPKRPFVFMIKEATVADTRPAGVTIEFVAVANLVPAFGAFYGSIDQLKHREFHSSEPPQIHAIAAHAA